MQNSLTCVKPFILTLRTTIYFGLTIISFYHQAVIVWVFNLTACGYSKFMTVICAFGELENFVHVEIPI